MVFLSMGSDPTENEQQYITVSIKPDPTEFATDYPHCVTRFGCNGTECNAAHMQTHNSTYTLQMTRNNAPSMADKAYKIEIN